MSSPRYVELQVTSHFSFLRGASSCEELFAQAALAGIEAVAIVDRNSLAGVVRAHEAAKTTGVRLIVGCRLDLTDGTSVLVYPADRPAYSRLCRLLSLGKKRGGKARCILEWPDLVAYGDGLIVWASKVGSENGTLTVYNTKDNTLQVTRGCFVGSVDEFLEASERKHDDDTHLEYRLLIEIAHSRITRARAKLEADQ